ncbi:glycoside hydrolase family 1 protein [Sphingomonas faeni]|uniref:glycoside hydrolase family 1 protein n=1 Tax=Sphingomonas faeni TaxID=185950 RepID=UPI0024131B20|nr:family 1 glycosylhydrolase [Sphingomonas faeni]
MIDRRSLLYSGAVASAALAAPAFAAGERRFPNGFLWGAATAAHQVEGNNTMSDLWLLEHVKPTVFAEPSGDAVNSFALWPQDMDIVKQLGLNSYRFSIEWARIEPEPGEFSIAMLDHYKAMIEGCRARGLTPIVTFSHFTTPRWFAAMGGWTNPQSPTLFARYCKRAAQHLAAGIGYAVTLNEPQLLHILKWGGLPPQVWDIQKATLAAASKAMGVPKFASGNVADIADLAVMDRNLLAAHRAGREAIKEVRPDLPVGVSLAVEDDQAIGSSVKRDAKRAEAYAPWLAAAKGDDFVGVQNYTRVRFDANGALPIPSTSQQSDLHQEIYPASLGNAVRYVHAEAGVPVMVTEHGVGSSDDRVRANLIPAALTGLQAAIAEGVPVVGYMHWSLLDNYEWIFGYKPKFGLVEVDRTTFRRTPKPSASVLGGIARANRL